MFFTINVLTTCVLYPHKMCIVYGFIYQSMLIINYLISTNFMTFTYYLLSYHVTLAFFEFKNKKNDTCALASALTINKFHITKLSLTTAEKMREHDH